MQKLKYTIHRSIYKCKICQKKLKFINFKNYSNLDIQYASMQVKKYTNTSARKIYKYTSTDIKKTNKNILMYKNENMKLLKIRWIWPSHGKNMEYTHQGHLTMDQHPLRKIKIYLVTRMQI